MSHVRNYMLFKKVDMVNFLFFRPISKYGRYVSLPHLFGVAIVELSEKYDYVMTQLSSSHL